MRKYVFSHPSSFVHIWAVPCKSLSLKHDTNNNTADSGLPLSAGRIIRSDRGLAKEENLIIISP